MTHKKHNKFSVKKRLLSFKYAFSGIGFMIQTQHNTWIHIIATIIVVFLGVALKVSLTEWCLLIFAIGIVLSSELFNTSIEFLTDLLSPEYQKKAGIVKDIAAGVVLISAIASAIIGLIVFLPRVIHFFS